MLTCWEQLPTRFHPANKCLVSGQGQGGLSIDESRASLTTPPPPPSELEANGPSSVVFQYLLPIKMQATSIPCWKLCFCL